MGIAFGDTVVTLNGKQYEYLMLYTCPYDGKPLIAYWKIDKPVGELEIRSALEDSGFDQYKVFFVSGGEGCHYTPILDYRERHVHRGSYPFLFLNPKDNINSLINHVLMDYPKADSKIIPLPKEIYIKSERDALEFYKNARDAPNLKNIFKWVDDAKGRGKPLFFCDTSTFYGNRGERETELMNILGPLGKFDWTPILKRLEMKKAKEDSVDE